METQIKINKNLNKIIEDLKLKNAEYEVNAKQ